MAGFYDGIQDHDFLSKKSQSEGSKSLENHQILAESLLGLNESLFTADRDLLEIRLAIVLQINFQVEQGIDPMYIKASSSGHSHQGVTYRDNWIDPRAMQIVERAQERSGIDSLDNRFGGFVSLRTD